MLTLTSTAFMHEGLIPSTFTCDGDNSNPPLEIEGIPATTGSLVLLVDDPDVPKAIKSDGMFDHWVLFNIPPDCHEIAQAASVGMVGANSRGETGYTGPCPPSQYEPREHRYFFKLYALDQMLPLRPGATKAEVEEAMQAHIIDKAELMGRYAKEADVEEEEG